MLPGGHELLPALIEQQKTVQPDEQLASGPHTDAYAVPGCSRNRHGFNANAEPTSVDRNKKLRRLDLRESPPLTNDTTFSETVMRRRPVVCARPSRQLQPLEHCVDLRDGGSQMEPARDHDVQAERSPVRGEEELAADLAGEGSLQATRPELVDGQSRHSG